jgi:hypothetical protein
VEEGVTKQYAMCGKQMHPQHCLCYQPPLQGPVQACTQVYKREPARAPVGAVLAVVKDRCKRLAAKRARQHGGVLPDWLLQLQLCPASDALHEAAGQARWA